VSEANRTIAGKTVLITGANRGIGDALVRAFADAGAKRILAAARDPSSVQAPAGAPVEPIKLDLAARRPTIGRVAGKIDILVNNAGENFGRGLLQDKTLDNARTEMQVNYFGPLALIRAVVPAMKQRGAGVIVNMLTILSHVSMPLLGSYCASKAAAWSMTQALRGELAPRGIRVIGIFPGAVDTRMSENFPPPKLPPDEVAQAVIAAIRDGAEDVYPGAMAEGLLAGLRADAKAVERDLAAYLPAEA
jgi:NAD(P)-dependent dehydrogenase (short-subunit alcohol dehydrogenase family)